MNLPAAIYAMRWLIRDTFRQAHASGLQAVLLGISGLFILFCFTVGATGGESSFPPGEQPEFLPSMPLEPQKAGETPEQYEKRVEEYKAKAAAEHLELAGQGKLTLAFGAFEVKIGRYRKDAVHFLELLLAGGVADAAGVLLALVWTAGFLPTFLEPSSAAVLLAKPVPRWSLLIGKYLGVLVFVLFNATVFVFGTWLALGLRTKVWDATYLLCILLLMLHFSVFYSFSAFMAVCTRSTVACVIGSILFWLMCWGMNYGRTTVVTMPQLEGASPVLLKSVEAGYWILPKPYDLSLLVLDSLQGQNYFSTTIDLQTIKAKGAFLPEWAALSSLLFAAVVLAASAYQFVKTDY